MTTHPPDRFVLASRAASSATRGFGVTLTCLLALAAFASGAAADPLFATPYPPWPVGGHPNGVAIGDVNRDGKPDLAVANAGFSSHSVSVLLGHGDGSFGTSTNFDTGNDPRSVAIGDLNGDGNPDLAVSDFVSNTISVLLGNGSGGFGAKTDFGTGTGPNSVLMADFNRDGKLDLAAANYYSNSVSVLIGNGDGTFGPGAAFATAPSPRSVAIGDLNRDGKLDLVLADWPTNGGDGISVLLGNGDGTFAGHADTVMGGGAYSVAVGDLNGDGSPDVVVATALAAVAVMMGHGDGTLGPRADFAVTFPFVVVIGDLDGDGKPDLAAANAENAVSVLLGNGDGTFGARTEYPASSQHEGMAIGDVNQDGRPDLAVTGFSASAVTVLLNMGTQLWVGVGESATRPRLALDTSRPNPAAGDPTIDFELPRTCEASLRICDPAGRLVKTLARGTLAAGRHSARWDRRNQRGSIEPPGIYFCELEVGGARLAKRLVLLH